MKLVCSPVKSDRKIGVKYIPKNYKMYTIEVTQTQNNVLHGAFDSHKTDKKRTKLFPVLKHWSPASSFPQRSYPCGIQRWHSRHPRSRRSAILRSLPGRASGVPTPREVVPTTRQVRRPGSAELW